MPYIDKWEREGLDSNIDFVSPITVGQLNYCITQLCLKYLGSAGGNYSGYNSIIGVLECAKLEFYRRVVSTYEDDKAATNGDVYQA